MRPLLHEPTLAQLARLARASYSLAPMNPFAAATSGRLAARSVRAATLGALALLFLALASRPALAADPAPAATAEALFREGRARMARGDTRGAATLFLESQRLQPAAGTLLNLAIAEEKLGQRVAAWGHARAALDQLPALDPRHAIARSTFESLDAVVPRLTILARAPLPASARVELDGLTLGPGTLGVPLPVEPGTHELRVVADGFESTLVTHTIAEGAREDVRVELGALRPERLRAAREEARAVPLAGDTGRGETGTAPSAAPGPMRTAGFVTLGSGVVGLTIAAVTGALALARKSDVDAHCDASSCDDIGAEASRSGRTYATVASVTAALGGALAIGGVVLLVASPSPRRASVLESAELRTSGSSVRLTLSF